MIHHDYGPGPSQFAQLSIPDGSGPHPVVVLIHGGFWRTRYAIDLMDPLVPSLVAVGYAVWSIEYRRVGDGDAGGGGWPGTFDDAAAAIDALADLPASVRNRLDLSRVATVGHSAGGHLATWLASRTSLPSGSRWADPAVAPTLAIAQAGVLDLGRGISAELGQGACEDLLGRTDIDGRIASASPAALLPIRAEVVAVHGDCDDTVPLAQAADYVADALAVGTDARLVEIEGADHFAHLDPSHAAWSAVLGALAHHFD